MDTVNLTQAKTHLSELLNKVEAGQEVVTTRRRSKRSCIGCGHPARFM